MIASEIYQLFESRQNFELFLLNYSKIANQLMYEDEKTISEIVGYMVVEIIKHSKKSPIYKSRGNKIIDKSELNQSTWYQNDYASFDNTTGGSTTGKRFPYKIWRPIYQAIEGDNHYKTVTDEFNIHNANILFLQQERINPYTDELVEISKTTNPVISHGLGNKAEIHTIIFNRSFFTNYYQFFENVIRYASENNIDIIHTKSNVINSLVWNIKRLNWKKKICKLLSNTGSKLDLKNVEYLKNNQNIDVWCDHMRCWDGGVTFFTCKYNTYHLMDSLSWAYTQDYKLISYDYFSLPSPFVNYWNGDYAEISSNYERCKCGRLYRRFEIGRTRAVTNRGITDSSLLQSTILDNVSTEGIIRLDTVDGFLRVFTSHSFPLTRRKEFKNLFPSMEVQFTVEAPL